MVTYELFFERIEISLLIGIYPAERISPQRYLIDLALEVTADKPLSEVTIKDVVDYSAVMDHVRAMAQKRYDLQEHFADELASFLVSQPRVRRCRCKVGKPDIIAEVGNVGVVVVRERAPNERR